MYMHIYIHLFNNIHKIIAWWKAISLRYTILKRSLSYQSESSEFPKRFFQHFKVCKFFIHYFATKVGGSAANSTSFQRCLKQFARKFTKVAFFFPNMKKNKLEKQKLNDATILLTTMTMTLCLQQFFVGALDVP